MTGMFLEISTSGVSSKPNDCIEISSNVGLASHKIVCRFFVFIILLQLCDRTSGLQKNEAIIEAR